MKIINKKIATIGIFTMIPGIITFIFPLLKPIKVYGIMSLILGINILLDSILLNNFYRIKTIIMSMAFLIVSLIPLVYIKRESIYFVSHLSLGIFYIVIAWIYTRPEIKKEFH